jgi:predicted nucleic acid-binding protein
VTGISNRYLLDSSAILAFIEDEPGAERVEEILRDENVFLPWVVLYEVFYISQREKGQAEAENRYTLLKNLNATILWNSDEPVLLTAARLKAQHRVSVVDSMIASYAIRNNAIIIHKDPELNALSGIVQQETLPFK